MQRRFYHEMRLLLSPLVHTAWDIRVRDEDRKKIPDGAIIASNHTSLLDPILLIAGLGIEPHFFAERKPGFNWIYALSGQIVLEQENGTHTRGLSSRVINHCRRIIKDGENIAIFPEGRRSYNGKLGKLSRGAAFLSRVTDAPVVPVYIHGAYEIMPIHSRFPKPSLRGQIQIRVGEAMNYEGDDDSYTQKLKEAMHILAN